MEFKFTKKQGEAWEYLMDKETTEVGYGGAAGGGKSWLGVAWIWFMANRYPGTKWFFGRKELTNLKKTTLATYYKFCMDRKIGKKQQGKLNSKDNYIKFLNGSEILLLDMAYQPSDPMYQRFGSLELTGGFIDEAAEISEQCITIINTRIGRQRNTEYGITPKMLCTFNPDKGYVYRAYYKPWKTGSLPLYRKFIPALLTDNKYIDENYNKQLQKADNITRQRLLYGNFDYDNTEGKLFSYDEVIDAFKVNIPKSDIWYISADVARFGNDSTVIGVWKGNELYKILEIKEQPTDFIARKIEELEEEFSVHRNHIVVDSDGLGAGVCDQLKGCINFVNNSSPYKTYSEKTNNYIHKNFGNLKTQCYYKLKELMEKRQIRINADGAVKDEICIELDNIIVKNPDKDSKLMLESKDDLKKRLGRSPDFADMLSMRMIRHVRDEDKQVRDEDLGVFEVDWSDTIL